jgi:hypothetical protein
VNQGTQKQARPSAHDEPASFAGTKPYTRSQPLLGNQTSEISAAKTGLDRDKPGCSGVKTKLFFTMIFQSQIGHFDTGRQDSPGGTNPRLTSAPPFDPLKTRVNTLKYAYARLSSPTEKYFFPATTWKLPAQNTRLPIHSDSVFLFK